ncbi:MAG: bacterial Ig-like domain-containing protein, partial [Clostridia bacterium]|nr:bacterial Ig-like domain-containing protein [Clostridia bacterium]
AVTKMMNWIMENYPADSLKESTELYLLAAGLKDSEILAIRKNLLETADGEPLKAESIEVTTLPRRLAFLEGKGKLNVVGGMITVRYNTGITESIWMDKSMVSGFDNTVVGPQTLTVSYMGATTTYEVEITPKSITGITLTSLPAKLEYKEGEEFDPAGLEVTADYDNGDRAALTDADYSIAGFESVAGEHTITVSAGGFTATFTVTVTKGVKRGDADGDGEITVADALVALRIAAKLRDSTPELLAVCDVDGDGEITVADALKILRVAAKLTDESALA